MRRLALDIGGANIKAAAGAPGEKCRTQSVAFALWREPQRLAEVLGQVADGLPPFDRLLVTMTAELCDCFATKRDGVSHVLDAAEALAAGRGVDVWTTQGRFVSPAEARRQPLLCAAANWHALASFVAALEPRGLSLLIDTGSTTTDILRLSAGRPAVRGLTDMQRLLSGELVYLGALRTSLAALGPAIAWGGQHYGLMAEYFATTADVFVLTGEVPEQPERSDTADGRPLTRACAAARIARMIGADLEMMSCEEAQSLAGTFAAIAVDRIVQAIEKVLKLSPTVPNEKVERVVLSGSGDFLAARAARIVLPQVETSRLADRIGGPESAAACAYALLQLAGASANP